MARPLYAQVNLTALRANLAQVRARAAKTQVLVRDGQTAVVGGIFQSTESQNQDRTPFLSKVPILGYLFKRTGTSTDNAELLLFITPRIVKS